MTGSDPFEAFVRKYQDMVFGTAARLLGNPMEAEDVAQVVFLRAFQRFPALAASPTAGGWLKTVTRNECLNHLTRYRARWRLFSEMTSARDESDSESDQSFEATLAAPDSSALDAEQQDQRVRLEAALQRLPDHQRVPLVLFHMEDMSYQSIADTLGVSLGKVKTDIHRGRETLRQQLKDDDASR